MVRDAVTHSRRALFLSHGGGPLPLLGDAAHTEMVSCLKKIAARIARPSAMIVVSAHWEEDSASVTAGAKPGLIYDYGGFPPEAYAIQYPCAGNPSLAAQIVQQLHNAGIAVHADSSRGFDHGLFVPLKIMYPEADIPCVQLSLLHHLDPLAHIQLGRALQGLDDPNILLIGSGFSFHNMRAFLSPETAESRQANQSFEQWLLDTCTNKNLSEEERTSRLVKWEAAPFARYCHPRLTTATYTPSICISIVYTTRGEYASCCYQSARPAGTARPNRPRGEFAG
jgi:aromatic ring-opening dioxygenase catalytic subunit (LigB family)